MLKIAQPMITVKDGRARLSAIIDEDGDLKTLWYEVDESYADGFNDRSDAFVVGLFHWAMVYHHDIQCEAPLSETLYFQLQNILAPVLAANSTRIRAPKITAPIASERLQTKGAVGTGCSSGIDSFHAIYQHYHGAFPSLELTHLCLFSVGHLYEHTDNPEQIAIVEAAEHRAEMIAERLGLAVLNVRSNYNECFPQTVTYMHTYSDMACVHAMGKLFSAYIYGSAGNLQWSLKHQEAKSCALSEIFTLPNLSTASLRLYSDSPATPRIAKLRYIANFPLATENLNVCCQELRNCGASDGVSNRNCGICVKCVRTLLDLECLGLLQKFKAAFDVERYLKQDRRIALRYMLKTHLEGSNFVKDTWRAFKKDLTFMDYVHERRSLLRLLRTRFRNALSALNPAFNHIPRFKDPRKR